ncbi:hypothetical protein EDB92DRAFT_502787 [Lactarius akahatsu]|uniref:Uncharacterized protein n=1 Tax=Lactarius akahatsu TaxID=416441 RepID=A0AAD4LSB0_9AGAM|nr:hypothetical protein EDB92DRAFT_502787 [Lactarius akahatsu]
MSPHHLFGYRHHGFYNPMFYGPSRFIWFSIGSLATLAWMHHHRSKDACRSSAQIGYDDRFRGHGQWEREASPRRFDEQQQQRQQQQQWGPPPPVAEASGRSPVDREQLDRLREMSRNAEETVRLFVCFVVVGCRSDNKGKQISGMSEATIDSMMGGLQRLKDVRHSTPPSLLQRIEYINHGTCSDWLNVAVNSSKTPKYH